MAEQEARQQQLQHVQSLIVQRSSKKPKLDEPSGEPESLAGRIDIRRMGDKAQYQQRPNKQQEQKKQAGKPIQKKSEVIYNPKKTTKINVNKGINVLNVDIQENLIYRPKTKENRYVYEQILNVVHGCLGDETDETLRSVADEVIAVLKMDGIKDYDKKTEVEAMLSKITPELFSTLLNLTKQITDYTAEIEESGKNTTIHQRDDEVDVALEMDQDDKEEDEGDDEDDQIQQEDIKDDDEDEDEENNNKEFVYDKDNNEKQIVRKQEDEQDEEDIVTDDKYKLDLLSIDGFWLQNQLNIYFNDPITSQKLETEILDALKLGSDIECQHRLVQLLNYEQFDLIKLLFKNRFIIYYCTRLGKAQDEKEKNEIKEEMSQQEIGESILGDLELSKKRRNKDKEYTKNLKLEAQKLHQQKKGEKDTGFQLLEASKITDEDFSKISKKYIDLESLKFDQGSHLMSNEKCNLPPGSWRLSKNGYEEVYIPAVKIAKDEHKLIKISSLPEWAQLAFSNTKELNKIQSKVFNVAFNQVENMLVCAPTGAGKTNIALLAMLQVIGQFIKSDGKIELDKFKIVYIAPMKALVTEIVGNFQNRLSGYGIKVHELTGDTQMTRQQIEETQVIVATPEKWDIITRKSGDRTYLQSVKLLIIDEIHLLHDERGPVLETIVARTIRHIESTQELIRIVGLSATLPNYSDVASFIRVKADSGLFYFDGSYRPIPLEQIYIGITEKKAVRRMMQMNEILYEKVSERAGKYQILIFVHSRRETVKTAKAIKEMAFSKDELGKLVKEDSSSKTILQAESENAKNSELKDLLPHGIAIHHAGLDKVDRTLVEDLFGDRHIQVLVSTATLAWGVNLPAHTVIIKGTQIYSPENGKWIELSPQDMLQMIGRAGRPRLDTRGEGIVMTSYQELKYYLSLLNQQLPIESQFINQLADQLNAEIVLGSVGNIKDGVNWLGYTYLYVRMLRAPHLYGITEEEILEDPLLVKRRTDLIHSAALTLDKHNLIKYDKKSSVFSVTALGKIASHYYIKYPSIATYNEHIKPNMGIIDLFRIFSLSHEFKFIPIREEEKIELLKLLESVPIPVKGSPDDTSTKINVLLQAYISRLKLDGYALNSDMVYVTQSASRIMRGLFEVFLKRGWAQVAEATLNLAKMIDKRMWSCMTPLRQFKGIPEEILRRIEKKEQFTWEHFYNMSAQQIGDLVKFPKLGKALHKMVHQFPRVEIKAYVQPITRSCLRVELSVTPDFQWDQAIHGYSEPFWIMVTDVDNEVILYSEQFVLKSKYLGEREYIFEFVVTLYEPLHPLYFIKVISDRWLSCEAQVPISFKNLILPEKFPLPTELLDLKLLPVQNLGWAEAQKIFFNDFTHFTPVQTQVFKSFYSTDESVFLGAPKTSGKVICMLLAILRQLQQGSEGKIVYVAPLEQICIQKYRDWEQKFSKLGYKLGLMISPMKNLDKYDILISSPEQWDIVSRRWRQRKFVQNVSLFIVDEIHLLGESGSVLEVITSRMRYIATNTEKNIRIIGLAPSIANYRDIAEWIGAPLSNTYNFLPNIRQIPLEIYIQGFDLNSRTARLLSMTKHIYQGIKHHTKNKQIIIFVSDRKQARLGALDMVTMAASDNNPKKFLKIPEKEMEQILEKIQEKTLRHVLGYGVGFIYEGMSQTEREIVEQLYEIEAIQLLLCSYKLSWEINLSGYIVVIMDTQRYDGQERRYIDYTIPDMLQMMGKAGRQSKDEDAKCMVFCHTPKKDFYRKFLFEPFPVESHLNHFITDHLNAEIVSKTIENKQDCVDWITWTFFYRRLTKNPNYYNLQGIGGTDINDYLSELIENTVEELEGGKLISVEEEVDLLPLNLGIIASFYYLKNTTIDIFSKNLSEQTKMKQLLEIISSAAEFEIVQIRHGEENLLKQLSTEITYKIDKPHFNEPDTKTNILLQCHFCRIPLIPDFVYDQQIIVEHAIRIVQAMVDVISSSGWLKPAILAMQISQQIVQAMWINDSQLYQIPNFTQELVSKCKENNVEDLADLMNMEDSDRLNLLNMNENEIQEVAEACNRYPSINLEFSIKNSDNNVFGPGEVVVVNANLTREGELTTENVIAPHFPKEKEESWWVVVGDAKNNKLYGIKRITLNEEISVDIKFAAPEPGEYELTIYAICDSYIGCDQGQKIKITVAQEAEE